MSKAHSRNYRGSDYDMRDSRPAARRSGKSFGDWLDDAIRAESQDDERDDDFETEDRLEAATRRLARTVESREAPRVRRRWRDAAREEMDARSSRRRPADDDDFDDRGAPDFDPQAIVDDAAAIVERRLSQSERQTAQALNNLTNLIKRSQRQNAAGEGVAVKRAVEAFTERAEHSERKTARALNDIAGILENGQRERAEAENGIVSLAERLARIESRLTEQPGPNATVRPIRNALARLESRLDRLSSEDRTAEFENALSGLDQRLADIASRLDADRNAPTPRDDQRAAFERARAAAQSQGGVSAPALEQGLRPASPATRRPLVDAIAEITQRQRTLDESYVAPRVQLNDDAAMKQRFESLQGTIDLIARQLDSVRESATERADQQLVTMRQIESLRREVQDVAHTVGELAPRASVAAVEDALRDLSFRVEAQRGRGVSDELLVPAERIAGELRAVIRELDPAPIVRSLRNDVVTIGQRLDAIQDDLQNKPESVDSGALRALMQQTHEIKEQLFALTSRPLPLEKIETRLFDLTQRVDSLSLSSGASTSDMGELVKGIRSIVAAETSRGFETFNHRLEQLAGKLDEAVARSGGKRFDELGQRIEDLGKTLAQRIDRSAQKAVDTSPLESLVAKLGKKIDSALDHKPHTAGFEEIGRKIDRLETRIDEAAPAESFARIEAMLARPGGEAHFADLAHRIDDLHKTLAARRERGVAASEPADMRYIEELVRGLDNKVEAALDTGGRPADLQGIERQLGELSYKIDRLEAPTASSRLDDYLGQSQHNPKLDEISERLERMQSALAERANTQAMVEAHQSNLTALVHDLAARVNQALDPKADSAAMRSLESQIGALSSRLDRTGPNGDSLAAIESRIGDLFTRIEDTRNATTQAAEEAVRRATQEILREASAAAPAALRGEVEREISSLRKTQDESGQRTHETLLAVHETLERVVDRLAMFEDELSEIRPPAAPIAVKTPTPKAPPVAARPRPLDAPVEPPASRPSMRDLRIDTADDADLRDFLLPPGGAPGRRREPSLDADPARRSEGPSVQSDFIAAARRAAQQAAADADAAEKAQQARRGGRAAARAVEEDHPSNGVHVGAVVQARKKPLLIGLAALVLLVGSYEIARFSINGEGVPAEQATTGDMQELAAPEPAPAKPGGAPAPDAKEASPAAPAAEAEPSAKAPAVAPLPRMIAPAPLAKPAGKSTDLIAPVDPTPTGAIGAAPSLTAPLAAPDAIGPIKTLAAKGEAAAQFEYGARLAEGRGLNRDPKAAAEWFEKAAEQGLAPAQYRLGSMYEKGLGVERSYPQARKWYQAAAEAGNARSMHNLAVLLAEGGDGKPDYGAASQWFTKAAEFGVRDSQFNLAILYARGLGVTQSLQQSYAWFAAAASQGDDDARKKRDEVGARLDSKELAAAKALVDGFKAKTPLREANDVLPPAGGWETVKDAKDAARPSVKPAGKAKVSQI